MLERVFNVTRWLYMHQPKGGCATLYRVATPSCSMKCGDGSTWGVMCNHAMWAHMARPFRPRLRGDSGSPGERNRYEVASHVRNSPVTRLLSHPPTRRCSKVLQRCFSSTESLASQKEGTRGNVHNGQIGAKQRKISTFPLLLFSAILAFARSLSSGPAC